MKNYTFTEKKDTRSGFGDGLTELGLKNENIVALCADLTGSLKMNDFKKNHPERFYQIGIAEANMMGIAAGLTIGGKIPLGNSPLGIRISNSSNYNITNSVIGSLKNVTTTLSQANEISFEWDTDSTYIEIGGELSYSKPSNSLNINSQPFVTQNFF